jgi:exosortase
VNQANVTEADYYEAKTEHRWSTDLNNPHHSPSPSKHSLLHRIAFYSIFCAIGIGIFWTPFKKLIALSFGDALYGHIFLIPIFSIAVVYIKRKVFFTKLHYAFAQGAPIVLTGLMLFTVGTIYQQRLSGIDYLSLCTIGVVLWVIGGFIGCFGKYTFREAMFPILFLFFMVPIPTFILDRIVLFLQNMTSDAVDAIFKIMGLTYLRYGNVFELPDISIKVAEQCSGIRSSLALIISATAAGYVFLNTVWRRLVAVLFIVPITIFKNALRVTALTLMAVYVDPTWLTDSWLHKAGGKPFFFVALLLWSPILWFLWRSEKRRAIKRDKTKKALIREESSLSA